MALNVASYMNDLSGLQANEVAKSQANQLAINNLYKPFDKELLTKALSTGGSLAQAPGFTSDNLWAMTPETFQATMKAQVPITKQISDAVQLNEMVTGNGEARRAATALESARLSGAQQNIGTAASMLKSDQALDESRFQAAAARQFQERELGERIRQHNDNVKLGRDRLNLESRRLTKLEEGLKNPGMQSHPVFDPTTSNIFADNANTSLDGTGKIKPGQGEKYLKNYALSDAYADPTPGKVLELQSILTGLGSDRNSPIANAYPKLIFAGGVKKPDGSMAPYGWYAPIGRDGRYTADPNQAVSSKLIWTVHPPRPKSSSSGASGQSLVSAYSGG